MKKLSINGFTLIELLVVISIISLLSSIVFASLGSARNRANESAVFAHFKEVQKALAIYQLENKVFPGLNQGRIVDYQFDPNEPRYLGTAGWEINRFIENNFEIITPFLRSKFDEGVAYSNSTTNATLVNSDTNPNTYVFYIAGKVFSDGRIRCVNSTRIYLEAEEGDADINCKQG